MRIDIQVQKQLRITIAIFAIIAAIPPLLGLLDVFEGITVLIWSVFLLGFIAVLLLIHTFWLTRITVLSLYSITGGYWSAILILVILVGGIDTQQTLHLYHTGSDQLTQELKLLFHRQGVNSKVSGKSASYLSIETHDKSTDVLLNSDLDFSDYMLDELLKQIIKAKKVTIPQVTLLVLEGDDPRMYQYSGLKPGDRIDVNLNWKQRSLERSESAALMLGSRDCNIRLPLSIRDMRIQVSLNKDLQLSKEKLGVDVKELSEEEKKIAQDLFMVAHKFEFNQARDSVLFDNLQYDGAGALILTASTIKNGIGLANDCDNKNNAMVELAVSQKDPFLTRLLFPNLLAGLESWKLEKQKTFIGIMPMFEQFPWKLQKVFGF